MLHQGSEQEIDCRQLRFYRFVWKNGVEILPAEALDFRGPVCFYGRQDFCPDFMLAFGWPEPGPNGASGSLDFQPFPPNIYRGVRSPPWKSEPDVIYRADRPLWMSVFITNRRGYERSVPVWTGPLPADKRPAGLRPILMGPGGAVARRQDAEPLPPNETKNLLPGESTRLFKLDLNAHFVVKTPGAHSLQIDFEGGTGLPKASIRQDFTFPVERK